MAAPNFFINSAGRLRSGWRLGIFVVTFSILAALLQFGLVIVLMFGLRLEVDQVLGGSAGHVAQAFILFTSAAVAGWACGAIIEDLPWRALGWAIHKGWLRDFLLGSVVGAISLMLAVLFGTIAGGFHFTFNSSATTAIARTLIFSGLLFVFAASAEEMLFRGYPLQTFTRARLAWFGILLTSVPFAMAHLNNPNVILRKVTIANTVLAGVWLAVAYLRTRSLWLPLGIHWAWNWTMAAVLGLPVSGITRLTPSPLLKTLETGPTWLTGGAYGPEGGAACTVALVVSIVFVWFAPWFSATPEMKKFTDQENPTGGELDENSLLQLKNE